MHHLDDPTDPGPGGPTIANTDEPIDLAHLDAPPDELAPRRRAKAAASRVPPHDLDAERAILGAALIDHHAATVVSSIPPDAWYHPGHGHIADAIRTLDDTGDPIDPVTVVDLLTRRHVLDEAGGPQLLADVMADHGVPASARSYATIITGRARLRSIIAATAEATEAAYTLNADTALARLEAALDQPDTADAAPVGAGLAEHLDLLEARQAGDTTTLPTGLAELDHLIDGLRPGELYIAAGRPAMGKSAVGGQLALNLARTGTRVLYVTIEMSTVELRDRWLANLSGVDIGRVHRGNLNDEHWHDIAPAVGRLAELPIDVLDAAGVTIARIRAAARATGAQAIVIDYLQLVQATGRTNNRQEEVAEVARGAKNLARALDVPVFALAQLHRGVEARQDKRPTLADLRDSGELENSAGVVIGLYRHDYYNPTSTQHRGELELIVLKNRHGNTATARVAFLGAWQRIANLHVTGARA